MRVVWVGLGVGAALSAFAGTVNRSTVPTDYPFHRQLLALGSPRVGGSVHLVCGLGRLGESQPRPSGGMVAALSERSVAGAVLPIGRRHRSDRHQSRSTVQRRRHRLGAQYRGPDRSRVPGSGRTHRRRRRGQQRLPRRTSVDAGSAPCSLRSSSGSWCAGISRAVSDVASNERRGTMRANGWRFVPRTVRPRRARADRSNPARGARSPGRR